MFFLSASSIVWIANLELGGLSSMTQVALFGVHLRYRLLRQKLFRQSCKSGYRLFRKCVLSPFQQHNNTAVEHHKYLHDSRNWVVRTLLLSESGLKLSRIYVSLPGTLRNLLISAFALSLVCHSLSESHLLMF